MRVFIVLMTMRTFTLPFLSMIFVLFTTRVHAEHHSITEAMTHLACDYNNKASNPMDLTVGTCAYSGTKEDQCGFQFDAANNKRTCEDCTARSVANCVHLDTHLSPDGKCIAGINVHNVHEDHDTCNAISKDGAWFKWNHVNKTNYDGSPKSTHYGIVPRQGCTSSFGTLNGANPQMCKWSETGVCYHPSKSAPVVPVCTCKLGTAAPAVTTYSDTSTGARCTVNGEEKCASCLYASWLSVLHEEQCKPNICTVNHYDHWKTASVQTVPSDMKQDCEAKSSGTNPSCKVVKTNPQYYSCVPATKPGSPDLTEAGATAAKTVAGGVATPSFSCTCTNGQKVDTCTKDGEECKSCDAGHFLRASDKTCVKCATAFFSAAPGATSCTACPAGTKGKSGMGHTTQASACSSCASGSFQGQAGQSTCTQCPAGTKGNAGTGYTNQTAACSKCTIGTFQNQPGQTSCDACPVGQHQDEEGKSACKANHRQCNAAEVETTKPTASSNRVCTNPSDDALDAPQKTAACNKVLAHYQDTLACGGSEQKCMSASLKSSDDRKECRRVRAIYRGAKCPCPTAGAAARR